MTPHLSEFLKTKRCQLTSTRNSCKFSSSFIYFNFWGKGTLSNHVFNLDRKWNGRTLCCFPWKEGEKKMAMSCPSGRTFEGIRDESSTLLKIIINQRKELKKWGEMRKRDGGIIVERKRWDQGREKKREGKKEETEERNKKSLKS